MLVALFQIAKTSDALLSVHRSRIAGSHAVCLTEAPYDIMLGEGHSLFGPDARDDRHPERRND